jgi:hypothetical protein
MKSLSKEIRYSHNFLTSSPQGCASMSAAYSQSDAYYSDASAVERGRKREKAWALPECQRNARRVLFVPGDKKNVSWHRRSMVEGQETVMRLEPLLCPLPFV